MGPHLMKSRNIAPTEKTGSFTIEIASTPVLVLKAQSLGSARRLMADAWLKDELAGYTTTSVPVWNRKTPLVVREASPSEAAEIEIAATVERHHCEDTKFVFSFLVPIDPLPN